MENHRDQFYEGEFFRGRLHGQGTCKWKPVTYEGGFYSNDKEGYALLSLPDNSYFEGLFIRNRPFGPGILTYSNGRQDAGFWLGRKLVRLSRTVDFIVPRLAPTPAAKIKLLQFRRLIPLTDDDSHSVTEILEKYGCDSGNISTPHSSLIYDSRSFFYDKLAFEKAFFENLREKMQELASNYTDWGGTFREIQEPEESSGTNSSEGCPVPSHCLCSQSMFFLERHEKPESTDVCDGEKSAVGSQMGLLGYFTKYGTLEEGGEWPEFEEVPGEEEPDPKPTTTKILAWNRSELCTEMLRQIFRYRAFEEKLNFKISKLMLGVRTAFRRTGEKEKQCLQFLKMCSVGPAYMVKKLLCNHEISEELMDARGNSSIMFASATDQHDIIDLLLDYGVDVNTFNDEGLTPLNLCLLRRLAQANRIVNWEVAFLPAEINEPCDEDSSTDEWRARESIPSLDRIFGDGTSLNESGTLRFPKETTEWACQNQTLTLVSPEEGKEISDSNQSTMINFNKSPGSLESGCEKSTGTESAILISAANTKTVPKFTRTSEFEKNVKKFSREVYMFDMSPAKRPSVDPRRDDVSIEGEPYASDSGSIHRIKEIDKTIEKLLERGADTNISEVPKPSIHLAVFTKDLNAVHKLLLYGASPDRQLYSNEGLLTPLHVLALLKPAPEFVDICRVLLHFGANPEEETLPEFSFSDDEKDLDPENGRTPLQLLCMRPDLEYADPEGHLIKMALLLAEVSNKKHYYKGHSCLTLAMLRGNVKLLRALLDTNFFDPNDVLGRDLGTALYVLTSTELQAKTIYDTSVKMCDLLIEGGADPLKRFDTPEKLLGTCIDYGYREIEEEKKTRKANASKKPDEKLEKKERDHLKDHIKVVEYLSRISQEIGSGRNISGMENLKNHIKVADHVGKISKESESRARDWQAQALGKNALERKNSSKTRVGQEKRQHEKEAVRFKKLVEDKPEGSEELTKKALGQQREITNQVSEDEDWTKRDSKTPILDEGSQDQKRKSQKDSGLDPKIKQKEKTLLSQAKKGGNGEKTKKSDKGKWRKERNDKGKYKKAEENSKKTSLKPSKSIMNKHVSETFPEKLRQSLLHMLGNCVNVDVNEFLLPYVVLRDGDLYYRFQGKATKGKEQYSLI